MAPYSSSSAASVEDEPLSSKRRSSSSLVDADAGRSQNETFGHADNDKRRGIDSAQSAKPQTETEKNGRVRRYSVMAEA
ncbi:hypothetical protein LTR28_009553 [Elasticomyces elasticus]|nr:hypothetical protein LTR28_009553 [Elasticomyces elasticus]